LSKESPESSQKKDLQVPPAAAHTADTCFTVHFKTSKGGGARLGKFYIAGYGYVPLKCQEEGAKCAITICGKNTLDIVALTRKDAWIFSITGDIGPLVEYAGLGLLELEQKKNYKLLFPTTMGGKGDFYQSYMLVYVSFETREWIATDSFNPSFSFTDDRIIMVSSRIVIRYIYYGRIKSA
jgi:hypothetical protein